MNMNWEWYGFYGAILWWKHENQWRNPTTLLHSKHWHTSRRWIGPGTFHRLPREWYTWCSLPSWTWVSSSRSSIRWCCGLDKHERIQRCWWYPRKLQPHQLNVITDKTEYAGIERQYTRDDESWRSIKKSDHSLVMTETLSVEKLDPWLFFLNWMQCG